METTMVAEGSKATCNLSTDCSHWRTQVPIPLGTMILITQSQKWLPVLCLIVLNKTFYIKRHKRNQEKVNGDYSCLVILAMNHVPQSWNFFLNRSCYLYNESCLFLLLWLDANKKLVSLTTNPLMKKIRKKSTWSKEFIFPISNLLSTCKL